jgi:hypothetical protein
LGLGEALTETEVGIEERTMARKRIANAVGQQPIGGKSKGTARETMREQFGRSDLHYPDKRTKSQMDVPGVVYCPRCQSISKQKRWFLDAELYAKLERDPSARATLCPTCLQIDNQQYDGEVILRGAKVMQQKQEVLNLLRNEEMRMRESNPLVRLASIEERDEEIYVLAINPNFAQRLGKAVQSAIGGELEIQNLPGESFSRVRLTEADNQSA